MSTLPAASAKNSVRRSWLRLTALCAVALQACVAVPHTQIVYDEQCKIYAKQMTLKKEQIVSFRGCISHDDCVAALLGVGLIAAASVVVSGSIVVAGNIVYWFEKQGQCAAGPQKA
jgi:hypothetical protein